jgi:mono/diheme cytochrome c family protein
MKLSSSIATVLAAVGFAAAAACTTQTEEGATLEGALTAKPEMPADARADLYHLSEGSEFLPYALVRALRVNPDGTRAVGIGGRPFLDPDNLRAHYNLIADSTGGLSRFPVGPTNATVDMTGDEALPIGVTLGRAPDTGLVSLGVNCAACHVGRIEVNGKQHVVDGSPAMFTIQGFYLDMITMLQDSATDPAFLARAAAYSTEAAVKFHGVKLDTGDAVDDNDGIVERIQVLLTLLVASKAGDDAKAKATIDALPDVSFSPTRKRLLLARYYFLKGIQSRRQNGDGTPGGFGRTDAFGVARNQLFGHLGEYLPTTAPVSYPPMFNMETNAWFHYNANTDSVLSRNIGQSLGLGAVVDIYGDDGKGTNATFVTSSNLANLSRLERAIYQIAPPALPVPRDEALARKGEAVYRAQCKSCHEPRKIDLTHGAPGDHALFVEREVPFGPEGDGQHIDTDPAQAQNFDTPLAAVGGISLPDAIMPVFKGIEDWYFTSHPLPGGAGGAGGGQDDDRAYVWSNVFDAKSNPAGRRLASPRFGTAGIFRTNPVYRAPPLDGIWSTAPFLHNGSVPTLRDLLRKAADRPKLFFVGQIRYDLHDVGQDQSQKPRSASDAPPDSTMCVLDTSRPGNSNRGHEFGTDLSDADKDALLEFLKGFGAHAARPTILD